MPETHFGYRQVPLTDKQALVDDVFHKVARRYDLMNDLMSAGLHRAWKDALVTAINPPTKGRLGRLEEIKGRLSRLEEIKGRLGRLEEIKGRPGRLEEKPDRDFALLDVAGGTGDVSFRTIKAGGYGTRATVADINAEMLAVGRERAYRQGLDDAVTFVDANAEQLPFPDKSFDAVSIAFGIRNVPRIDVALGEMQRVLKLGGRFLCLEFSNVDVPGLDALYELYSFNLVPAIGRAVVGDAEPYRYLVESIRRFPRPDAFADMMRAAGLKRVSHRVMSGGIVALHSGWRL
jgi:demethylmenaquinone methyltransferase/2-methoxy-6-polyprenyl-1,4-benzoquinol methylase